MQGTILIIGGNKALREEKVNALLKALGFEHKKQTDHPDILVIKPLENKSSIGISQSRELATYLSQKPFSALHKVALIEESHKLTIPAQNALLKVLEEPPSYATIILEAKTENALLPTVVSRCQRISIQTQNDTLQQSTKTSLKYVYNLPLGERLAWAEEQSKESREAIIEMLEHWLFEERKSLLSKKPNSPKNLKLITTVKKDLEETNVTLRLALEFLVLKIRGSNQDLP